MSDFKFKGARHYVSGSVDTETLYKIRAIARINDVTVRDAVEELLRYATNSYEQDHGIPKEILAEVSVRAVGRPRKEYVRYSVSDPEEYDTLDEAMRAIETRKEEDEDGERSN